LLEGLRRNAPKGIKVLYARGVERPEILAMRSSSAAPVDDSLFKASVSLARKSDIIIFSAGISPNLEGEEMDVKVPGFSSGDRTSLDLPASQVALLEALKTTGKPIIVVLTNGSALAVNWAQEHADAIVEAWYPGEEGGNAVAEVIWGKYNPAGRLPVTFYKSANDLPAFDDYAMKGRTYRYFSGKPLYAFGYGLSYNSYVYNKLELNREKFVATDTLALNISITNNGKYDGDEVVQVYVNQPRELKNQPLKSLIAFERVHFKKGETRNLVLIIPVARLRHYNLGVNDYSVASGNFEIMVGAASDDTRLKTTFTVK
jgi:beta-glucosidase